MKRLLHAAILAALEFVYPYSDGTKREKLTPEEWAVGVLILVAFLVVLGSWIVL
jgi:hypothetical protein